MAIFQSEATFPRLGGDFVASANGAERRNRGGDNLPLLIPFSLALVRFSYTFTGKYLYYFTIIFYYLYYFSMDFSYRGVGIFIP